MLTSYCLPPPTLHWGDDGVPRSHTFDDVYFDKEAGLDETRYVFLQHNRLSERWKSLSKKHFVIAETGFGTGLNFLCAWKAFIEEAPGDAHLHFLSVEKFPLSKEMLEEALSIWPSLIAQSKELIASYPIVCHGLHRIELAQGRIQLSLWFGEAEEGFRAINANVDAWFLDGFAPSKNPQMWTPELFRHIRRLSHTGTTFSTFTAAGIVRRGLKGVGFDVRKVKGFGHKREMAIGELHQESAPFSARMVEGEAWFNVRPVKENPPHHVLVVGSGLAGANTAFSLANQGIKVTVWEQGSAIAGEASGNPQGMLYPKLATQDTPINRFYLSAYLYANRFYSSLDEKGVFWNPCGLVQFPKNTKEQERFQLLLSSCFYPERIIQKNINYPEALFLPLSGWVIPPNLCRHLLGHENIEVKLNTQLTALTEYAETERANALNRWRAFYGQGHEDFSHVVLCTANDTKDLPFLPDIPYQSIRGQISSLELEKLKGINAEDNTKMHHIQHVLCADGYVSPPLNNTLTFGATYDLKDMDDQVRLEGHERNLAMLEGLLKMERGQLSSHDCNGRVSFRCAMPDYSPAVGPIYNDREYRLHFAQLSKNAKWKSEHIVNHSDGLYINIGHGSRGLVSTPLSGCYIASLITGTPSPLEQSVINQLHSSRFLIRALKRGEGN